MKQILIISSSVRDGAKSPRVATYFKHFIEKNNLAHVEIADLVKYQFPVFDERLRFQKNPLKEAVELSKKIKNADGVLIVTPEYNGGYPASLKNITDVFYDEWKHKPIAIATVSDGVFGGSQVITSLLFTLWKIGALMVPATFPVPSVEKNYDELGNPTDKEATDKRAKRFIDELLYFMK